MAFRRWRSLGKRTFEGSQAIWQLGKRSLFIPSALLFILGWSLFRWADLPDILFKAGLTSFFISIFLCLQDLERDLTPETAIAFFQLALFIPFPVFLSIVFNILQT